MSDTLGLNWLTVAAVAIATVSVARTARLLTYDDFPPVAALRERIKVWLLSGDRRMKWVALTECPFCLAPYLSAVMLAWMYLSDLHWTWWIANGWWAMSYAAAILVARDEPGD